MPSQATSQTGERRVAFGPFTFDAHSHELRRGSTAVPLQRQPARVLSYLVSHAGRIVTRAELIQHLWPAGHHVDFERGLNYCVRQVRMALADSAASPSYVETVPQKGYRWIASVANTDGSAPTRHCVTAAWMTPVPVWRAVVATVACAVLTTSLAVRLGPPAPPVAGQTTVAFPVADDRLARLQVALNALHRLSHALLEPERRSELPMAIEALWSASIGRTHR